MKREEFKLESSLIGMSRKDLQKYSLLRAIRQMSERAQIDGIENEASLAVERIVGREPAGIFVPQDVLADRALNLSTASQGGYLVGTDVLGESMIDVLHQKTVVIQVGATTLTGLVGNASVPRKAGSATVYWLSETENVPEDSDLTVGQVLLTPHRVTADIVYTRELVFQSSPDVENFLRKDIMSKIAVEKDRVAISGSGVLGQPLGLVNTTGINSLTFGGAATWADVLSFEAKVANDNAEVGQLAYVTTPDVREKWKGIARVSGGETFLWEGGTVGGVRAEATKQVPGDKMIFANWEDLILADWAGVDVLADPYSLKKKNQIELTVFLLTDVGVRHSVSFCVSTDAGNQ